LSQLPPLQERFLAKLCQRVGKNNFSAEALAKSKSEPLLMDSLRMILLYLIYSSWSIRSRRCSAAILTDIKILHSGR
jgi:hypothetical protein